jgi:hypothetical protein
MMRVDRVEVQERLFGYLFMARLCNQMLLCFTDPTLACQAPPAWIRWLDINRERTGDQTIPWELFVTRFSCIIDKYL